jgi:ribosomal-protein-alanine N-acetyltransferase
LLSNIGKGVSQDPEYLLTTERLGLRPFRPDDARAVFRVFDDIDAVRFYPDMTNASAAAAWISRNQERYQKDGFGLWAACLLGTGELIGDCGLTRQSIEGRSEVEIGYHVRADCRGRGFASEAAQACLEYGFRLGGCHQVVSMVHPGNEASRRVADGVHDHVRRFERLGDQYYLFYTERREWLESCGAA